MKKRISIALLSSLLGAGMSFNALAVDYSSADVIARIQEALNEEGYDCGTPDGKAGAKTGAAVSKFREDHNLAIGDELNDDLATALGLLDPEDDSHVKFEPAASNVKASILPLQDSILSALQPVLNGVGIMSGTVTDYGNASTVGDIVNLDAKVETDGGKSVLVTCQHIPYDIVDWNIRYVRDMEDGHYYYMDDDYNTNIYDYKTGLLKERLDAPKELLHSGSKVPENIQFSDSVPNDVTGKWRLATVTTDMPVSEYLIDYYKNYFKSDDEIHGIINRRDNTTTCISVVWGMLYVHTHKYVENEESDAKVLFGGDLISEEYYDKETGQVADF